MKRTMTALLLVLALALTAICGVAAETATDLAQLVEGTWEITDIQGIPGADQNQISAAMELIKSMGGSILMTFHSGTVTIEMSFMGQNEKQDSTYQISGDKIIFEGAELDCSVSGNQMTLTDGSTTMVLTKSGSGAVAEPDEGITSSEGLIGSWKVIEDEVQAGSANTLPAQMKSYVDNGDVFIMTFDGNNVTLVIEGGDGSADSAGPYTVSGNTLTIGGFLSLNYEFLTLGDTNYLVLTQDQDQLLLEFVGEKQETSKNSTSANGIEGSWQVTGVESGVEGSEQLQLILQLGGSVTITFENGKASMTMEIMGQSETVDLGEYTDNGDSVTMNGGDSAYTIEGDTLKLTDYNGTMTMVRK